MLVPSTELEAINYMLATIGESPVNSTEDTGVVDAELALQTLRDISRKVQTRGWHFNTEENYTLTPTFNDGELIVPANAVCVDTVGKDRDLDLVQRGSRMYDRVNHTYSFTDSVTVDMIVLLDFDELPQAARSYIIVRASRIYQEHILGSSQLSAFSVQDERVAYATLLNTEAKTGDYNMLSDNFSVSNILMR